jgi:hypothetical protein
VGGCLHGRVPCGRRWASAPELVPLDVVLPWGASPDVLGASFPAGLHRSFQPPLGASGPEDRASADAISARSPAVKSRRGRPGLVQTHVLLRHCVHVVRREPAGGVGMLE